MTTDDRLKYIARLAAKVARRAEVLQDRETFDLAERIVVLTFAADYNIETNRKQLLEGIEE